MTDTKDNEGIIRVVSGVLIWLDWTELFLRADDMCGAKSFLVYNLHDDMSSGQRF